MSNNHHPHIKEIDDRLRDNVRELVEHLRPPSHPGKRQGHQVRYGRKHGLAVDVSGANKGRITPFDGEGKGRSPFQFIQDEMNCSFPAAVEWAANWVGIPSDYKPDPDAVCRQTERRKRERLEAEAQKKAGEATRTAKAVAIWKTTQDATGTPVETYLNARGITASIPPDIRYQPPRSGSYGAMVVAARDNDGNLLAVQRVFIHDGKKAPVETSKRTNGVMDGAAVRLPAMQGDELVLAEGPETGLSVWQAWGRETWVALGSIAKLVDTIPTDRPVVVARDADELGSQADKALMKAVGAMIERGVSVRVVSPPNPTKKGYDFNDALMDYGSDTVATTLENGGWLKPRYPAPSGTVDEARQVVHIAFSAFTKLLPPYWAKKKANQTWRAL